MTPVGSRTPPIAYHQTAQRCCQRKHERTGEPMDTRAEAGYAAIWTTEGTSGEKTVTEAKWLACTDPTPMWDCLWEKGSKRKRRLFACACCRRIWHLLAKQPEAFRHLVELSEQAADGLVTHDQLDDAWPYDEIEFSDCSDWSDETGAALAASGVSVRWDYQGAQQFAAAAATGQPHHYHLDPTIPAVAAELNAQANLLRCLFGNPFRPVTISPRVLAWNNAVVVRLAQAGYEERQLPSGTLDNGRLAVLADALDEAGCSDPDILGHLRKSGPHVRGCWPVDLLLGKS